MEKDLVSIVIPIYNAGKFLDRCISSVINQTYRYIEVILVNDGSTDRSDEICKKYAEADKRIKYISQQNQGVVSARKNGTELASGRYVGFVDADDYIETNLYQKLMGCQKDFDLVISRWFREDGTRTRCAYDKIAIGEYSSPSDMEFLMSHLMNVSSAGGSVNIISGIMPYMFTKLYKTAMANEVFKEVDQSISFGEDLEFTYRYILKCKSILITDICGYHYNVWSGSAAHMADRGCKYLKNVCKLYEALLPVLTQHPQHNKLLPQWQTKISYMIAKAPGKMGFAPENRVRTVFFPFCNMLDGKRVVLCGAGPIGQIYRRQIMEYKLCEIAAWIDPLWEERRREGHTEVAPLECLLVGEYEYVVLAVEDETEAKPIREYLHSLEVAEDKILWRKPYIVTAV